MPQEEARPLTTKDAVIDGVGTLVKPKDDVVIVGTGENQFLPKDSEHTVHIVAAAKLVDKGAASYKDSADQDRAEKLKLHKPKAEKAKK